MVKTRFFGFVALVLAATSGLATAGQDTPMQLSLVDTPVQQYNQGTVSPGSGNDVPAGQTVNAITGNKVYAPAVTTSVPAATSVVPTVVVTPAPTATTAKPVVVTPVPTTIAPTAMPTYTPPPVVPSLPNWVGPKVGAPMDSACYRKSHLMKKCPPGYQFDKIATCWAECPLEYPVECGMECIPQNKDCALEVISKVNAVATVALNAATSGVFGQLSKASKGVQTGVKCGQQLYATVNKIVDYVKELETEFPSSTKAQFKYLLSKSDFAVYDLPVAVTTCLGLPAPAGLEYAAEVIDMVKKILDQIMSKGESILDTKTFLNTTAEVGVDQSITALDTAGLDKLQKLIDSGITCGADLKSIINRVIAAVKEIKTTTPSSPIDMIRLALGNSDLFLKDIPAVTSSCVPKNADGGFATRDDIRKTFQVIIDEIIDSSSNGSGKPLSKAEYALRIADMGLDIVSQFDPTGIAALAKEFIQPICGPTSFLGEIDDGKADVALGLRTMGKAFTSSSGTWTKAGKGNVTVSFVSVDSHDVTVNIISGGDKIDEVLVKKGKTASWTRAIADLKDKTLYLDRWRPGFFGIPGTGGGSLLLWVPHSSTGGDLQLRAQLNVS